MAALPSTRALRRFIYLIVSDGIDSYTLHRIDTKPLFAAGVGVRAQQGPPPRGNLPRPLARFDCADGPQFLPLGHGVEKIVSIDANRRTVIFDTRTKAVRAGPDVRHIKWHVHGTTWAEAGGRLYHLSRGVGYDQQDCLDFEALTYDHHRHDWFWSLLPSPPFESSYMDDVTIESFADAGAGNATAIRVSTSDCTYAFDAVRASWHKQGDWALPFRGRAQYIADYGLWFGFADDRASDLCAADLDVADRPERRHIWANIDGHANHTGVWVDSSFISYMGSGRFCVTRFFTEMDKDEGCVHAAVVTAVEAKHTAASASGEMQMVTSASVYYRSTVGSSHFWAPFWVY